MCIYVEYGPVSTKVKLPKKTSCMYICQHCLVHLGDIGQYLHCMLTLWPRVGSGAL